MTVRYEVIAVGFHAGVLHKPGDERHGYVVVDEPFKETPSWLRRVGDDHEDTHRRKSKQKEDADKVKRDKEDVKGASFLGKSQNGVETLG